MMIEIDKLCEVVEKINNEIYDLGLELNSPYMELHFNGWAEIIKFLGEVIWSSEDEGREYFYSIDNYEPIEGYLRREVNKLLIELKDIVL